MCSALAFSFLSWCWLMMGLNGGFVDGAGGVGERRAREEEGLRPWREAG